MNVFLRNEFIFQHSSHGRKQKEALKILHDFTDGVIIKRRNELKEAQNNPKAEVEEDDGIGAKKKLALLDILLHSTIDGKPLSNMDIREEVDTFMFEGLFAFDCLLDRNLIFHFKDTTQRQVASLSVFTLSPSIQKSNRKLSMKSEALLATIRRSRLRKRI